MTKILGAYSWETCLHTHWKEKHMPTNLAVAQFAFGCFKVGSCTRA